MYRSAAILAAEPVPVRVADLGVCAEAWGDYRDFDRVFFGDGLRGGRERIEATRVAKRICEGCPVRAECLAWAMRNPVNGVWGGTTEAERGNVGRPSRTRKRRNRRQNQQQPQGRRGGK